MSDDLDRAVDARMDAYRPDELPPYEAIQARKRRRDRRRMAGAASGFAAAVTALALVTPTFVGGADRLAPEQLAAPPTRTAFEVQTRADAATPMFNAALARCQALPGAQDETAPVLSSPPAWVVTVEGSLDETTAVRNCLAELDGATVRTVPAADPGNQARTFYMVYDGTGSAASYTAGVERCLRLPGVRGNPVRTSSPSSYKMSASGDAADALATCLGALPGASVKTTGGSSTEEASVGAFISQCVGTERAAVAPEYVGLSEAEATRGEQPATADSFRVVGRDGECLDRTSDLRVNRVNLLIVDGKVVWAGKF